MTPHRSPRSVALLLLVLLVAVVAGLRVFPAPAPVPAAAARPAADQDATRVATIQAAFTLLMDQFYRVPDPAALLNAAWAGAARALARAGYAGPTPPAPLLPLEREDAWGAFADAYPGLASLAPPELTQAALAFAATEAMAGSLSERHTGFLSPEEYQAAMVELSGEAASVGAGVVVNVGPPWVVTEVAPGGPASVAGVRPGDTIVEINSRDAGSLRRPELVRLLSGEEGTVVVLALDRPDEGRLTLVVTRGPFSFPDFEARVLAGDTGYVRLRSFSTFLQAPSGRRNVIQELDVALELFEGAGVTAWVIDLRDNPGGFVFTANELAGRFLAESVMYTASNERGNRGEQISAGRPFRAQRSMAVLVNGGSSSSSEVFASAMQEHGRAVVVGTQTAGALAGALLFPLPDGAGLQIAVEEARTGRRGAVVDEVGVAPDMSVPDTRTAADYAAGRDPQLEAAVFAARVRPAITAPDTSERSMDETRLGDLLRRYLPAADEAPPTPLIRSPRLLGELALRHPSQFANALGPVASADEIVRAVRQRGWQGSYSRFYGEVPALNGPYLGVTIDLYASPTGAYAALNSNDAPQVQRSAPTPLQLGDGAVAYTGTWVSTGAATLVWRAGRAVVTVVYYAVPGQESFEPVLALARLVDARLRANPVGTSEPPPGLAPQPVTPAVAEG